MDKRLNMPHELVQLTLHYITNNGDDVVNVVYMHRQGVLAGVASDSAYDDGAALDQAQHIAGAWHDVVMPALSDECALTRVDWVWNPTVGTGPLHEGTYVLPVEAGGGQSGGALPWGTAKNFEFKTGLGGRGNHGRVFLPGIPSAYSNALVDPDQLTTAGQTNLNAAAAGLLAAVNNNTLLGIPPVGETDNLCVASFILHGALRSPAVHHDVTEVLMPTTYLDYQRRRAVGHSRHR